MTTARYDILAKIPAGTTKAGLSQMLQTLLQERFGFTFHYEDRETPVFKLGIANSGLRIKEGPAAEPFPPEGFPKLQDDPKEGIALKLDSDLKFRWSAYRQTMADLAAKLKDAAGRPVVDATGLTGTYYFTLEFAADRSRLPPLSMPPDAPSAEAPGPPAGTTIFDAVTKQLGLRLTSAKAPIKTLVVDRLEKTPTEN